MRKIGKKNICSAPSIEGAMPPSAENLLALLEGQPESYEILFSLGNVYLRTDDGAKAVECYRKALRLKPNSAELCNNLGVAYISQGDLENAIAQFKKALLLDSDLSMAQLHLCRAELDRDNVETAHSLLEKLVRTAADNFEVQAMLGEVWKEKGDVKRSITHFEKAFEINSKNARVRNILGFACFLKGKEVFEKGYIEDAFEIWGKGYKDYSRAFVAEKRIAQAMTKMVREFVEKGVLDEVVEDFRKKHSAKDPTEGFYYKVLSYFFFSIGLQPELYFEKASVDQEIARWQGELRSEMEYPFPRYLLGILHAYKGNFLDALEELSRCADTLPQSKKRPLKIERIISFVKVLRDIEGQQGDNAADASPVNEWELCGFSDPFQQQAWKKAGVSPDEAARWRELGVSAKRSQLWRKCNISTDIAGEWLKEAFDNPDEVMRWTRGAFSPEQAKAWREPFPDDPDKAVQFFKAGFEEPQIAAKWSKVFMFPWEAIRWFELGFSTRDAALWLANGIKDPFIAKQRQMKDNVLEEEARQATDDAEDS